MTDNLKAMPRTEHELLMGHNKPPISVDVDELKAALETRYSPLVARVDALEKVTKTAPKTIKNDEVAGKVTALIKEIREAAKAADTGAKAEREPWNNALAEVRGFFVQITNRLTELKETVKPPLDDYLHKKKEKKRLAAEEKERKLREEADKRRKEAEDAERRKRDAEEKRAQAEAAAARAEEERARLQQEAEEKRSELRLLKEKADKEKAEAAARESREAARVAKEKREKLEREAVTRRKQERSATSAHRLSESTADRTESKAVRQTRMLEKAPDADFARTHGEHGTVGTLRRQWTFDVVDRSAIPLDQLRGYLNPDHVDAAIYRFMMDRVKSGTPTLPGVEFEQISESEVR